MWRKSVLGAVCTSSNGAFETSLMRRIAVQQQRSFTCTSQRNARITHFTPASSPALDSLLNDIRDNIILPSYLPFSQRMRIYSPKWEKRLQADPVTIEIDGEVIKFRYRNRMAQRVAIRKKLHDAIAQFKTPDDFANLRPLLEGITRAGCKLKPGFYDKVLRVAGTNGQIYNMIDCARSVRSTGYKLDTSEKVNEVLHFVQMMACDAEWAEVTTRKALRWAEIVIEMLYEDEHRPERHEDDIIALGALPLNRDPMILAAPLHLAAVLAAEHGAGEDVLKKVHKLSRDVMALWPETKGLKQLQHPKLYTDQTKLGYLSTPNKFATLAIPLLHGFEAAIKVLEPELAAQLQIRHDTLAAEIKEAMGALPPSDTRTPPGKELRAEAVYKKYHGGS